MPPQYTDPYAFDYERSQDGSVRFSCSTDVERFGWLALPPQHPAVIQTQNFWASIGAIIELDGIEASKWTALTWTDWECGMIGVGHAVRGTYTRTEAGGGPAYAIALFDEEGRRIAKMRGRGVVFRHRNFAKWRETSKADARKARPEARFVFADRSALGLTSGEFPFVAPLDATRADRVDALVTQQNGLPPANRYLGGSGDHVNSTHIAEVARQALCLMEGRPDVKILSGEMSLTRYVELGTPIRLEVRDRDTRSIRLKLTQIGRVCSEIGLNW